MKKLSILLMLAFFTSVAGFSQTTQWLNYTVTTHPYPRLAISETDIWACSYGGIIQINRETEELTIHNHVSSNLNFFPTRLILDSEDNVWFYDTENIGKFDKQNWESIDMTQYLGQYEAIIQMHISNTDEIFLSVHPTSTIYQFVDNSLIPIYTSELPYPENQIADIAFDSNDNLWLAFPHSVMRLSESDTLIFDPANSGIPDEYISDIFFDSDDRIWVVPEGLDEVSLVMFDGDEWFSWEKSVFANYDIQWNNFTEDANGIIYLSSFNGIWKFENDSWDEIEHSISTDYLTIDSENKLWCLSQGQIKKNTGNEWISLVQTNNTLDEEGNFCIADAANTMYIGSKTRIASFDGTTWDKYDGMEEVYLLAVSDQGKAMAVTGGQIKTSTDMITWQVLNHPDFPNWNLPYHKIYPGANNEFWIGTNNGLFRVNDGAIDRVLEMRVNDIVPDENGNIWLATEDGLIKYNQGIMEIYNTANSSLEANFISHISDMNENRAWLSVQKLIEDPPYYWLESYLTEFVDGDFTSYDTLCCQDYNVSIGENQFLMEKIIPDTNGGIWVNYRDKGLMHFNEGVFTLYNYANSGLASNRINDFLIDASANIYLLHHSALSIFNPDGITIGEHELLLNNTLSVYPNPSSGQFYFNLEKAGSNQVSINISDMSGRLVYSRIHKAEAGRIALKLHSLKPGIYVYEITNEEMFNSGKLLISE